MSSNIKLFVDGFASYCEIPAERVRLLKWNEKTGNERNYEAPENGVYSYFGATEYDQSDGFWHLGITLMLGGLQFIGFVLCVTEESGKPVFRFGLKGTLRQIDLNDLEALNELYEELITNIKEAFENDRRPAPKTIGFKEEAKGTTAN